MLSNSNFGDRLEEERTRLGLKKGEMAAAGNVAPSTYTSYLRGERIPDLLALAVWSKAGVDPLYVVTGRRNSGNLPQDEEALLDAYRGLNAPLKVAAVGAVYGMGRNWPVRPPGAVRDRDAEQQQPAGSSVRVGGDVGQYFEGNQTGAVNIDMSKGKKKRDQ
ncbi:helix-turn-helix domain-containing protein [Ralstonia pseudosolanacearum]